MLGRGRAESGVTSQTQRKPDVKAELKKEGDKDLNSPRELSPEAEKELALVEKKVQDGHVDRVDPKLDCILVILPSTYSPTGILMQREDIILECIFLPNKQSKKLKTYVEKISALILKGKLRLHQLAGIDPAEIVVPLTKEDIEKLWAESEPWQRACSNFLGEINSKYPKSDRIELIKRADWILPRIVRETPISGVRTFYTDANKQGKAGYKSEDLSKVVQCPYNSVQKSELYAILLVLMDFSEPLNIVTDSQYAERVVLHIETAEFIPDESELTSLFIQLQDIIRNRKHPLYITHIRSHTGLPGPLAQVHLALQLRLLFADSGTIYAPTRAVFRVLVLSHPALIAKYQVELSAAAVFLATSNHPGIKAMPQCDFKQM
ncbi:hypothetical protein STEG23_019019 [Scotinomys teguina]